MSTDRPISQVLPGRLMHRALKEDVIAYLRAAPLPCGTRRTLYRRWCEYVYETARREDLDRAANYDRKQLQPWLLEE